MVYNTHTHTMVLLQLCRKRDCVEPTMQFRLWELKRWPAAYSSTPKKTYNGVKYTVDSTVPYAPPRKL